MKCITNVDYSNNTFIYRLFDPLYQRKWNYIQLSSSPMMSIIKEIRTSTRIKVVWKKVFVHFDLKKLQIPYTIFMCEYTMSPKIATDSRTTICHQWKKWNTGSKEWIPIPTYFFFTTCLVGESWEQNSSLSYCHIALGTSYFIFMDVECGCDVMDVACAIQFTLYPTIVVFEDAHTHKIDNKLPGKKCIESVQCRA